LSDKISIERTTVRWKHIEWGPSSSSVSVLLMKALNSTGVMEDFWYFPDTPKWRQKAVDAYLELTLTAKEIEIDMNTAINSLKEEEEELLAAVWKGLIDERQELFEYSSWKDEKKDKRKAVRKAHKDLDDKNDEHEKFNHEYHKLLSESTETAFLEYNEWQVSILLAQLDSIWSEIKDYNKALATGAIDSRSDEVAWFLPWIEPQLLFILWWLAVELEEQRHDTWFDDNKKVKPDSELYEILHSAWVPVSWTKWLWLRELLNPFTIFNMMTKGKVKKPFNKDLKKVFTMFRTGKLKYSEAVAVIATMRMEDKKLKKVIDDKMYEDYLDTSAAYYPSAWWLWWKPSWRWRMVGSPSRGRGARAERRRSRWTVEDISRNRGIVPKDHIKYYETDEWIVELDTYMDDPLETLIDHYYEWTLDEKRMDVVEYVILDRIMKEWWLPPTTDEEGNIIYTSFENNMVRLWDVDWDWYWEEKDGEETFWNLMQEHIIDDNFVGDMDERYTNALDYNKAKNRAESIEKWTYIYDHVGLLDDDDEDWILVNAFVVTLSKKMWVPAAKIANMFAHYKGDFAVAAWHIKDKAWKELGEASLLETAQHQWVPWLINRWMNQLVWWGFVTPKFASWVNRLTTTLLGAWKLGTILATWVKSLQAWWNWITRWWHKLFSWNEDGSNPKAEASAAAFKKNAWMKSGALKYFTINQWLKIAEDPDGYWDRATSSDHIVRWNVLWFLNPELDAERKTEEMKKQGIFEKGHSSRDLFYETVWRQKISTMISRKILIEWDTPNSVVINPEKFEDAFPVIAPMYSTKYWRKWVATIIDKIEEHLATEKRWTWDKLIKYKWTWESMLSVLEKENRAKSADRAEASKFEDAIKDLPSVLSKSMASARLSWLEPESAEFERVVKNLTFAAAQRKKLSVDSLNDAAWTYSILWNESDKAEMLMKRLDFTDKNWVSAKGWLEARLQFIEDNADNTTYDMDAMTTEYFKVLSCVFREVDDPTSAFPSASVWDINTYEDVDWTPALTRWDNETSLKSYFQNEAYWTWMSTSEESGYSAIATWDSTTMIEHWADEVWSSWDDIAIE